MEISWVISSFMVEKLINEVGCILIYFESACFTHLQVGSVIFLEETLPNFREDLY